MRLLAVFLCIFLHSCAGYKLTGRENPFAQYGIQSISVPMFINKSSLANVSGPFTREIFNLLNSFNNLEVISGNNENADAVLVGIVNSRKEMRETVVTTGYRVASATSPSNLGSRGDFSIPGNSSVRLRLKLMLLKRPTKKELEILTSEIPAHFVVSPKVIFMENISATSTFNREIFDGENSSVNYTQTKGSLNRRINKLAESAANSFRNMIIYAF